jgi:hypothetical protein
MSSSRKKSPTIIIPTKKSYFIQGKKGLSDKEKSFCRCVIHVEAEQPDKCLKNPQLRGKKGCYNEYAVCAKSVGTSSRQCSNYYNFDKLPDNELRAYALERKVTVSEPFNREETIAAIEEWKRTYVPKRPGRKPGTKLSPVKKSPGSPKKYVSPMKKSPSHPKKYVSPMKKSPSSPKKSSVKKTRGRPRKSDSPVKKTRGRPRKT